MLRQMERTRNGTTAHRQDAVGDAAHGGDPHARCVGDEGARRRGSFSGAALPGVARSRLASVPLKDGTRYGIRRA